MNVQKLFKKIQKEYNKFIVKTFARSSDIQKVADELYGDVGWVPMHINCNCIYEPIGDDNLSVNTTNQLLKKYNRAYVPGEKRSQEYNNTKRTENKLRQRLNILDQLIQELPETSKINKDQKTLCRNLITTFNTDFKYLHRQAKDTTIILAFIFYQKKLEKPGLILQDYKICTKYELTTPKFINICCRIANYYMVTSPINIRQTTRYDHEILIKNGGQ